MALTADVIARQVGKLLPRGAAWRGPVGRLFYGLILAVADELARIYQRARDLIANAHPATIDELLEDWEAELGLPADCVTAPQTLEERLAAISAKLNELGGQDRQYYIDLAAKLGIVITIEECRPFEVGVDGCGDPVGEIDWRFTWIIHAPPQGATYLDVGTGRVGDPLVTGDSQVLSCVMQGIKPAHTTLQIAYDG